MPHCKTVLVRNSETESSGDILMAVVTNMCWHFLYERDDLSCFQTDERGRHCILLSTSYIPIPSCNITYVQELLLQVCLSWTSWGNNTSHWRPVMNIMTNLNIIVHVKLQELDTFQ